jgi:hypothetical protein
MPHPTDDELVLLYYQEMPGGDRRQAGEHLQSCDRCRQGLMDLERTLKVAESLPIPERGEDYGREVWARISPRLAEKAQRRWGFLFPMRAWLLAGSIAALVVVAFWSGRWWQQRQTETAIAIPASAHQRILMLAVGDHLERALMLLVEVMHQEGGNPADVAHTEQLAEDLVQSNRLYRQAALRDGDSGVGNVLDELERVLLVISHSPGTMSKAELATLQRQIEAQGILFKVRVVELEVRESQRPAATHAPGSAL